MPSFDIVSEIDMREVRNGVEYATRELATRWDFRNVTASVELSEKIQVINVTSEYDVQVNQLLDILRDRLANGGVESKALDIPDDIVHSGKLYYLEIKLKQGIETSVAKQLVKLIKDSKIKVQSQIQGEQVSVPGKSRDDLQQAIAVVKNCDIEQPFQFTNFRD